MPLVGRLQVAILQYIAIATFSSLKCLFLKLHVCCAGISWEERAELTIGHILWPVTHVTHQSADPWPAWPVTHDPVPDRGMSRSRLHDASQSRLLPSIFCSLKIWIWLMQYKYTTSSCLHSNCYKPNTVVQFFNYLRLFCECEQYTTHKEKTMLNLLHVYTSPNHGSSVLQHWPVTYVTHSHLSTHLTHDPWPADPLSARGESITNIQSSVQQKHVIVSRSNVKKLQ